MILAINEKMRIKPNLIRSHKNTQGRFCDTSTNQDGQRGFTLLELIIVIVIIGVMSAIAIPAFASWREKQTLQSASQTFMSHMKQARVLALAENRHVYITFPAAADATSYIFDTNKNNNCSSCKNHQVDFLNDYPGNLKAAININAAEIRFSSRGTVLNAGTVTLTTSGYSKALTFNIIGRIYQQ